MIRIFTLALLTCCISKTYSQSERAKPNLSVRFLTAGDITVQSPDGGKSFANSSYFLSPGFDVCVEFPKGPNLLFSTGYRWKHKWISLAIPIYGFEESNSDLHSIFAKLFWRKPFLQSHLPNVFSFDSGGGLLISRTIPSDDSRTTSIGLGGFTGAIYWKNIPDYSAALDGMINLNARLYKRLYASAGYGFNYGIIKIKEGSYSFIGPDGVSESGTVTSRGSYIYLLTGLKLKF